MLCLWTRPILEDLLSKFAKSSRVRDFAGINTCQIKFARLLKDFLLLQVLVWRDVLRVEWTVKADISVLDALELLVTILSIFLIKFIKEALLNRYRAFLLLRSIHRFSTYI